MGAGESQQARQPCHRPVVVDDLRDHTGRPQPGRAQQIHRRLGVARSSQHAARMGAQREDMAGPGQIGRDRAWTGQYPHGAGAVGGGDARGDAGGRIDRYGVGGALRILVDRGHRRQRQPVEIRAGHRHAQHAAGVADHEGDRFGRREFRGQDEIAFVLAVLVVDHDHRPAGREGVECVLDGIEFTGHRAPPVCLIEIFRNDAR